MLRDEYAFWPWFDKSVAATVAVDTPGDCRELHARATEILRSLSTYPRLTTAALGYEWVSALRLADEHGSILASTESDPRRAPAEAAARLTGRPEVATLPESAHAKAGAVVRLLSG